MPQALCPRLPRPSARHRQSYEKRSREIAKTDLRSEFRGQPREPIRSAPRADAARNPDHDEWVEGEAIPVVHASNVLFMSP
jgi:hypothetical protein